MARNVNAAFMAASGGLRYVIPMYAIITGCGRLGTGVARALAEKGHDVVVVDEGADFRLVGDGFDGLVVDGSPIDSEVLALAGMPKADLLVAATSDDKRNILTAQIAVEMFHVPTAIARVSDPSLAAFYRSQGVSTVCPTATGINQVMATIQGESFPALASTIDPDIVAVVVPGSWVGVAMGRVDPGPGRKVIGVVSRGHVKNLEPRRTFLEGDSALLLKEARR